MNANVLVTAAGSIVAQGIIKSLKLANGSKGASVKYKIVCVDVNPLAAGLYRCDAAALVPPATSHDYIDSIIASCKNECIRAIFIGSDDELIHLAAAKKRIEQETDAIVITSPINVLSIARDKWKSFEFLTESNLPTVPSALPENSKELVAQFGFPVVVKPRQGYGSLHVYIAKNDKEIEYAISAIRGVGWDPVVQKYLVGEEFTSGVTIDMRGRNVMSSISMRKITKHGQTYKAFIDEFSHVCTCAEEAALKIGARGSINIQTKIENEKPAIFEINPRFSATCPMRSIAGVNEPDIVFRNMVLGEEIRIRSYEKLVCMRYWNEVYVPYSTYEQLAIEKKMDKRDINSSFIPDYF